MMIKSHRATLIEINIDDMLRATGWRSTPMRRVLFRPFARRFAQTVLQFDAVTGEQGLAAGSRYLLEQLSATVLINDLSSSDYAKIDRPILYLANHPGLTDTIALFSWLPHANFQIIAAESPFLACLPHVSEQLIYVDLDNGNNFAPMRQAVDYLKQGGTLVTFPAGKIEPDPAVSSGAVASLESWVSVDVFSRLVPNCLIVPILISGVFNRKARHHPLVKLRTKKADQEWAAAILQLSVSSFRAVHVQIDLGEPIDPLKLPRRAPITPLIRKRMSELIMLNYAA